MGRPVRTMTIAGVLAAMAIPPLVFGVAALDAGMTVGETLAAVAAQYGAARQNLLVTSAVGLIPLALLALVLLVQRAWHRVA